ncbi:hypothetical protein ACQKFL_05560 [Vreelandella titanicae]|uniref:hypothetical protein n=1 Tax=Vreelandella titanicae TaxID=664683 RepID=UPI003D07CCA9|tara:strand:- start:1016 stop:1849 length:834 start_codon:yes stop_codon:yes gene_type:complete
MDCVFSKVKGRGKKLNYKLLSDCTLFDTITVDIDSCPDYDPDHNLDEDSWFKIKDFSQKNFCLQILKDSFDSKDYDDLKKGQFHRIAYIFSKQGNDFYFQKVTPSLFVSKKTIAFGEAAELESNNNRLIVKSTPDAVYFSSLDVLIFRNLATISSIFTGIDTLFKEATHEEVEKFLGESFIELGGSYDVNKVTKPNRKRIALAVETLSKMSAQEQESLLSYVNDYCKDKLKLDTKSGRFSISKDEELKLLLYGIEQRFYTTPVSNEKRLANSVQKVD